MEGEHSDRCEGRGQVYGEERGAVGEGIVADRSDGRGEADGVKGATAAKGMIADFRHSW